MHYCAVRPFPWLAWFLCVAFSASQGVFAYLLWNRRGRVSWYVKTKATDRPLSPMLASGALPASVLFGALALAVVFRYGQEHVSSAATHAVLLVMEYLAWGLFALTLVMGLMLFFFGRPQSLIPPPFRKRN